MLPNTSKKCIYIYYILYVQYKIRGVAQGLHAVCISYVTSVRYVAGINHEARGRAVPKGRVIYSGNVPNRGRDISNLCRNRCYGEWRKMSGFIALKTGLNQFLI